MPKLEQVLLAAVSLLFLPMVVYAGYLAVLAFGEGQRLATAPILAPGQAGAGGFYRVDGAISGGLLAPAEFPAVKDALQLRAQRQTRSDTISDNWVDAADEAPRFLRAESLAIAGVPFAWNESARVVAPVREAFVVTGPRERWHVHYRTAAGLNFALFGVYEHGRLQDGAYDRILLVTAEQVAPTLAAAAAAGRTKGVILSAIALVMAGLGALSLKAALKGSRGRRGYGQE